MPEGVGYSSNNVVAGTGLELNIVNKFAYGYSGQIDLDNTTQTLLSFQTGNYTFVGQWQMVFDKTAFASGESIGYTVKLNNIAVARLELEAAATTSEAVQQPVSLIIPPYTTVTITGDTDGGSIVVTGLITGRIYT
jgi:hypothetical protein